MIRHNRLFITGSNGFVGKNLIQYLNDKYTFYLHIKNKPIIIEEEIVIHLAGKAHDLKNVSSPDDYESVSKLILPGVGTFGDAMDSLNQNNLTQIIHEFVSTGKPFLGICLGMQMAVIEFARNILGWKDAHSTEMNPETSHAVIDMMADQKNITAKGGTMRLG